MLQSKTEAFIQFESQANKVTNDICKKNSNSKNTTQISVSAQLLSHSIGKIHKVNYEI